MVADHFYPTTQLNLSTTTILTQVFVWLEDVLVVWAGFSIMITVSVLNFELLIVHNSTFFRE